MFYGPLLESFAKVKNGIVNCIMKEDICCSYPPYETVHVQRDKVKKNYEPSVPFPCMNWLTL